MDELLSQEAFVSLRTLDVRLFPPPVGGMDDRGFFAVEGVRRQLSKLSKTGVAHVSLIH